MNNLSLIQKALLVIKDTEDNRSLVEAFNHYYPHIELIRTDDVLQGLETLQNENVNAIFIEYPLAVKDINFFLELQKSNVCLPVVVTVEQGREIEAAEALRDGASDYIMKNSSYAESLPGVIKRIQSMTLLQREDEEELEQHSLLFKQIYRSQKWWQNIIDAITDYLFVIDQNYRILRTNKAFAGLFGKVPADIIRKPYYKLFGLEGPHEWCVISKNEDTLCPRSVERKLNEIMYLISCFPIYFDEQKAVVYIMKDITETRRLKDQIYHLDKLSSLGTLTSGVAHEINNPLTGIIGYTEMLLMKKESDHATKYLNNIYDSAIRCKKIVENMLTFSRQTTAQKSLENINDIIDKTIELHEYWLKSTNIEIVRSYEEIPYINVDRQQTQQVFLNLLINAEQAIAETDKPGRIEFRSDYDNESGFIGISISDNGAGIPHDVLPKIFDPFFTTKPVNKGTGLGLSIAHGIIAEQGGTIEAKSELGKGTSFMIRLPRKS